MYVRLVILSVLAACGLFFVIGGFSAGVEMTLFGIFFVGGPLAGIAWILFTHTRFKMAGHYLVLKSPLTNARRIDLDELVLWRELSYSIRGQTRRSLVLLFPGDRRVMVDNQDYPAEYDELQEALVAHYDSRRHFSVASSAVSP